MGDKDRWIPNAIIKSEVVYKFNESPAPKRGSVLCAPPVTKNKQRGSVLIQLIPTNLKSEPGIKQTNPTQDLVNKIG